MMIDTNSSSGKFDLNSDCHVNYIEDCIPKEFAEDYADILIKELDWTKAISLGVGNHEFKRLALWYGPIPFVYTGARHESNNDWHFLLNDLLKEVNSRTRQNHNCALVNYFESGKVALPFHGDNEDIFKSESIGGLSFGGSRTICFRKTKESEVVLKLKLGNGSLYEMHGESFQRIFQHSIPSDESSESRISITFRTIKPELIKEEKLSRKRIIGSPLNSSPVRKTLKMDSSDMDLTYLKSDFTIENKLDDLNFDDLNFDDIGDVKNFIIKTVTFSVEKIFNTVRNKVINLEKNVKDLVKQVESQKKELDLYKTEMGEKIKKIEEDNEEQEQYHMRQNLLIYGIPERDGENCDSIIYDLAKHSGMNWFQVWHLHRCHRLGDKDGKENKIRPIIARFVSFRDKILFIKNFINFHKPSRFINVRNIFLKDHLTKKRLGLLNDVLNFKVNNSKIKSVFYRNGIIHVSFNNRYKLFYIKTNDDFLKLKSLIS